MRTLPGRAASRLAAALATLAALGFAAPARGQLVPSEPFVAGGGRLTIGGDVSVTLSCAQANGPEAAACADDTGFFNYTDYEHSAVRLLRVGVTASLRASRHFSVLGELRSENANNPQPYALYVRIRPWTERDLDVQIGRVPPTFGAFARRTYASDNILIGYPLAYQYLTSLRPDALPASANELLSMRGRGWLSDFSVGDTTARHGMALASAFRWDTGIQVHAATALVDATASITAGTLANPLVKDDNAGKQLAGRLSFRPTPGLLVGVSGARGPFMTRRASRLAGIDDDGAFTQTAWGADAEYSRGYYLVRFEAIVSDWRVPILQAPVIDSPLRAVATSLEGRYKVHPRAYVAARVDHLGFSTITGTFGADTWDAPVSRVEVGGGYALQRDVQVKLSVQRNTRAGGRATRVNLGAAQLLFWF